MAKKVKLTYDGYTAYPITITDAIADLTSNKNLTDLLSDLRTSASGWKLEKDSSSDLVYYLKDSSGNNAGTINIPQDTFLDNVTFTASTGDLTFIFNTVSGKQNVVANLSDLIDTYTAGNGLALSDNSFSIKIADSSQKYVSVTADGLAITGVNEALALKADKSDVYTKAEIQTQVSDINSDIAENAQNITNEANRAKEVESKLRTDLGNVTDTGSSTGSAFARITKLQEDLSALSGSSGTGSISEQISNAISTLKGDMEHSTIGALEDTLDSHISNTTIHITAAERIAWNDKVDATKVSDTEYGDITDLII